MTTQAIQAALLDPEVKKILEEQSAAGVQSTAAADLAAIRTAVIAALAAIDTLATAHNTLAGALNTLATKLNADDGVTDADYVTNNATNAATDNESTYTPAALTTV
jgi:hypothetical protein